MKKCICLICIEPNPIWINFLNKFRQYDIFIVCDNNTIDYSKKYNNEEKIQFIQMHESICLNNGFINLCEVTISKPVTAWDKALYYFSSINTDYDHVWMIEDDVFFYNENTILRIDNNYKHDDLLTTPEIYTNMDGAKSKWQWHRIFPQVYPPYSHCMCCVIRISSNMLGKIKDYAQRTKRLFFLEAFFPTLCISYNLRYGTPVELMNVVYRQEFAIQNIDRFHIYHPIKQINDHKVFRSHIDDIDYTD
jgi:hypothetical protein